RDGAEDELEEPLGRCRRLAAGDRRQVQGRARAEGREEAAAADDGEDSARAEGEAESDRPVGAGADAEVGKAVGAHRAQGVDAAERRQGNPRPKTCGCAESATRVSWPSYERPTSATGPFWCQSHRKSRTEFGPKPPDPRPSRFLG